MYYITCPYCDNEQVVDLEDCLEDEVNQVTCKSCNMIFGYEARFVPSFEERKLPCANGEPHKWRDILGIPSHLFSEAKRCIYCGEEDWKKKEN